MTAQLSSPPGQSSSEDGLEDRPAAAVDRLLKSAPLVVLVGLLAVITRTAGRPLDNYDTWFHLRLGAEFDGHWAVAEPGSLSRFATTPWVPTQWLTEVVAHRFEQWWGVPGVAWLFGALYLAFALSLYFSCRREASMLPSIIATILGTLGAGFALSARPQVVSLILLVVATAAWLQTWRDGRPRWWLVPLSWLWAMSHGLWSVGVVLGAVSCLGLMFDGRATGRVLGKLWLVPTLSLIAAAFTPVGPRLLTSQTAVFSRSSMITEWGPTSFRDLPALVVAGMVAVLLVLWARRGGTAWTHILLTLFAAGATMYSVRLIAVGALMLAPVLASSIQDVLPEPVSRRLTFAELGTAACSAAGCLLALAVMVPHAGGEPSAVPSRFSARLTGLPAGSAVLNTDYLGGWIEWQFPRLNPVIDGMLDAYPVGYIRRYAEAAAVKPGWKHFVAGSHAQVAVLRAGSPLAGALRVDLGWERVAEDRGWVYLQAPAASVAD